MTAPDGSLDPRNELYQLSNEGLFSLDQFIGVDVDSTALEANVSAMRLTFADQGSRPRLHHGDIVDVLWDYEHRGELRASVVNLDTISEGPNSIGLLRSTLNVLNHIDSPTMVVWNVISARLAPRNVVYGWDHLDGRRSTSNVKDLIKERLMSDSLFYQFYQHGWDMFPEDSVDFNGLRYESSKATQMSTFVFVRRLKSCKEGCAC